MIFKDSTSKHVNRDKGEVGYRLPLHLLTLAPSFIKVMRRMSTLTTGKQQAPLQGFMWQIHLQKVTGPHGS